MRRLVAQAKKFLKKGHRVKISILFRGREKKTAKEAAKYKMDSFSNLGKVINPPRMVGSGYAMTLG